jgi:WD40 repeat protein
MQKGNRRILLMALLVVLGFILVLYWQRSRSQVWVAFQHDEPVRSPGLFEIRCEINAIAFSPDGQWLASGSWNLVRKGELMLWGVKEGKSRRLFSGDVTCLAFSPNGRWLASGHHDGMVRVWIMPKGQLAWAWALNLRLDFFFFIPTIKREVATDLAFSPDSKLLAIGTD